MKRKKLLLMVLIMLPLVTMSWAANVPEPGPSFSTHPVDMGTMDCIECHQDISPVQVNQWEQSAHGFAMVHCQVCHGDVDTFLVSPGMENCRSCHADQVANNIAGPEISCSACHIPHYFTVHKVHQYK